MTTRPFLDALAFSSLLAAGVGFTLCLAVSASLAPLSGTAPWRNALLVAIGAFIIYTLDRLRDTQRDRSTSPTRTAFIERHRAGLTLALVAASVGFGGLLFSAPSHISMLCLFIGLIGLFHRRLKSGATRKSVYVSSAWILACVGIPWLTAGRPPQGLWAAAILFPVLLVNLIASNMRDDEHEWLRQHPDTLLTMTLLMAVFTVGLALFAPQPITPLVWIPIAEGAALLGFRKDERYGLLVIDGALLAGSLATLFHASLLTA